jgi:hypothetical protein
MKASQKLASEYRRLVQFVYSLPMEERWKWGKQLKALKIQSYVEKESEAIK